MSSILAGLDNQVLLEQRTYKLWESAGHKIVEAQLTADQIKQLFTNIEQGATAAGGNRTMIGKGKDAAGAVNKAWTDLKDKVYNSGPMSNFAAAYDKQAEKLKQATGGDQGVFKYVQKYRDFAEKHPIIQGFVYSALIAAAGITGAGLGGAAVLGLFKLTDQLLQGKDIRSAIYQGAKTGALAYGASKLGDLIRGDKAPGAGGGDAASAAAGNLGPREVAKGAFDIVKDKIQKGEVTDWNSYQQAVNSALEQAAVQGGKEASRMSQDIARKTLDMYLNRYALDASGTFSGSGPEKIEKIITALGGQVDQEKMAMAHRAVAAMKGANESVELNEATIKILFSKVSLEHSKRIDEGIMDTLKGAAGKAMDYAKTKGHNLTTKVTADKLNTAWEKAGKPTDSDKIAEILKSNGVPEDVMKDVFAKMQIPVAAAPAQQTPQPNAQAAQQPAAQPAQAAQPAVTPKPTAAAPQAGAPRQPKKPVPSKPTQPQPGAGRFATKSLYKEDADKVAQLEMALRQAREITKGIKYDETVNGIIVEIQQLAAKYGIDPKSIKYAVSDVLEARNNLESAVYGLDEVFKDAYQEAKWKHDDEEEGLAEERPKSEIEVNPNDNFTILDIKKLEQINDLDTLKKQAKHLIKGKPIRRMKPEKIAYFYDRVDTLTTRMKVIKLMYDLLLAGEGLKTIGSWNSTDPNAYAKRFNEEENKPKTAKALIYQTEMYGAKGYYGQCKEPGCDHKTKTYDRVQQAQNAIKKHHQEHFKGVEEGYSAGAVGGAGLGIEKSPIEKVLEKPLNEYDTKIDELVLARVPKGLTIEEFYSKAYKEWLFNQHYEHMREAWDSLYPWFAKEYREKHGIKEYNERMTTKKPYKAVLGDTDFFDEMLRVLPKGLPADKLYRLSFKEWIYNKFGGKDYQKWKALRHEYWDAYKKSGGDKKQGFFSKLKDKMGLEEDMYTDSIYKEFLDSEYNKNEGSYIDTLRNLGQFIRSKGMPEEKAKPLIRKLIPKLHPSGINEEQLALAELKCWTGYKRVPGTEEGEKGSCTKAESAIMKGLQTEVKDDGSFEGK